MLTTQSIEKALALTGTDERRLSNIDLDTGGFKISIERFSYYLLSPTFIEKFSKIQYEWEDEEYRIMSARNIGRAIYEYQSGNEQPLQNLLSKIP